MPESQQTLWNELVHNGGPWVGVFVTIVFGGVLLCRYGLIPVLKSVGPLIEGLAEISRANLEASKTLESVAEKFKGIVTRIDGIFARDHQKND